MSYHGETCEPCGLCGWCVGNFKAKKDRKRFLAVAKAAINAIDAGFPNDPEEEKANASYRAARRAMFRLQSALDKARKP